MSFDWDRYARDFPERVTHDVEQARETWPDASPCKCGPLTPTGVSTPEGMHPCHHRHKPKAGRDPVRCPACALNEPVVKPLSARDDRKLPLPGPDLGTRTKFETPSGELDRGRVQWPGTQTVSAR